MTPRIRRFASTRNLALASCILLGLAFCLGSLADPLVLDGAVNQYVAREWLWNGSLPYRDTFDHRAPGIYLVHLVCLVVFGGAPYGIRFAEILAMVGCARFAAAIVTPLSKPVDGSTWAAAFFGGCVVYYGFLDYWCTAQCEIWLCLAALGGLAAAVRTRSLRSAAALTGLCLGAALLVKPPGALLLVPALAHLYSRCRLTGAWFGSVVAITAGALTLPGVVLGYFALRGGLPALVDVLVGANAHYVTAEPENVHALAELSKVWHYFAPFSTLLVVAVAVLLVRSWLWRADARANSHLVLAAFVLSIVVVVGQRKFFLYHWGVLVMPTSILVASIAHAFLHERGGAWKILAAAAVFLAFYASTGWPSEHWMRSSETSALWSMGRIDRETFIGSHVGFPQFYGHSFRYADRERVGEWLGAHSAPTDEVLVRGMAAEIYLISNRRAPSRFFWSLFLSEPTRAYHRDEWLRDDADALLRSPPRWVVTYTSSRSPVESVDRFESMGYHRRIELGELVVLERTTDAPVLSIASEQRLN